MPTLYPAEIALRSAVAKITRAPPAFAVPPPRQPRRIMYERTEFLRQTAFLFRFDRNGLESICRAYCTRMSQSPMPARPPRRRRAPEFDARCKRLRPAQ